MINYIGHMLVIGLALGYTIRFKVPNTIKGVSISNPSIEVQVLKIYFIPSFSTKNKLRSDFYFLFQIENNNLLYDTLIRGQLL